MSVVGCHDDMTMDGYEGSMDSHMGQLTNVVDQYVRDVDATADAGQLGNIVTTYHGRMSGHMNGMSQDMGGMLGCRGSKGERPDTSVMQGNLGAMQRELDDHHGRILGASDTGAARREVSRHRDTMSSMMSQMRGDMGTMMSTTRGYECDHCDNCGH
jgi:hypothetical protein